MSNKEELNLQKQVKDIAFDNLFKEVMNDLVNEAKRCTIKAKIIKIKYDCLITEGFSPDQALELCKYI